MKHFDKKRNCFVVAVTIFMSGCGTDGHLISIPEAIASKRWTGRPVSEAVSKWGTPNGKVESLAGGTFYEWIWAQDFIYNAPAGSDTRMMPGNVLLTTNYYQERMGRQQCKLWITTDSKGMITKFETTPQGNHGTGARGCTDFHWGSNAP